MENFKNSQKPENELIKESFEDSADKKENLIFKKDKIDIDENLSPEFIYKEQNIDFPDHLVKETGGVKGYIRKTVEWKAVWGIIEQIASIDELKEIFDLVKKYHGRISEKDMDKEPWVINSMEDLHFLKEICHLLEYIHNDFEDNKKIYIELGKKKVEKFMLIVKNVSKVDTLIINKLGNDFISNTNIHLMSQIGELPDQENNFGNKMLLQRIYEPEVVLKILPESKSINDYDDFMRYKIFGSQHGPYFNIYSVNDLKPIEWDKTYQIFKEFGNNSEELLQHLKDNSMFLEPIVGNYSRNGLSVSNKGFWDRNTETYNDTKSFFGFSNKNKAYLNYLKSCNELYKELLEANKKNEDFNKWPGEVRYEGIKVQTYIYGYPNLENLIQERSPNDDSDKPHPVIPVIINYPEIPDLRWCHCSYACIPNKKGINIIEMKS